MGTIDKVEICIGGYFQEDYRGEMMDIDLSLEEKREERSIYVLKSVYLVQIKIIWDKMHRVIRLSTFLRKEIR